MLLKRPVLDAIQAGRISLVFRKWRRPTVKAGGTLKTAIGVLAIDSVDRVAGITDADAKRAGYPSRAALMTELSAYPNGSIYRIAVKFANADPRIALREHAALGEEEWRDLESKLQRMDERGPWTFATLDIISRYPTTLAATLAEELGVARDIFKPRVRRLKELGLTESLEIGYRLSPRGRAVLKRLRRTQLSPRP